jgi:hypothetical protein
MTGTERAAARFEFIDRLDSLIAASLKAGVSRHEVATAFEKHANAQRIALACTQAVSPHIKLDADGRPMVRQ